MFLAWHGQGSKIDGFSFFLAEKLGKTVQELGQMPAVEMAQWRAYYAVKNQAEELARKVASH